MSDDPFDPSGRGERTVFRPNPGGRRPAQPGAFSPPPAAPPPQAPPHPQAPPPAGYGAPPPPLPGYGAPPQPGPGRYQPPPAYPPPQSPPPRGYAPAAPQSPQPRDSWGLVNQPYDRQPAPPPPPAILRRDEMILPHQNPIMRAAGPMLLLLGRLRIALMRASFAELMENVAESVKAFELDVRAAGVPDAQANVAKYVLCATADDIVQNIPSEDRHVWAQYSMLSRFFGERIGGVRFFQELDRAIADPMHSEALLELQHACLALGFQGVHRTTPGGQGQLQETQRRTYEVLQRLRRRTPDEISPRWRGLDLKSEHGRIQVPFWVVGAFVLAGLSALFLTYRVLLGGAAEAATAAMLNLHQPVELALARKAPAPPPPRPDPPAEPPPRPNQPLTQLQRIRAGLSEEIATGQVEAAAVGTRIVIRVGSALLFESGRADVRPEFAVHARKIAQVLEKEPGPIRVVGHTDNTPISSGRFRDNYELSVARAKAVAEVMKAGLSDAKRLATSGQGDKEPVAKNDKEENRKLNRRVEIWIDRID